MSGNRLLEGVNPTSPLTLSQHLEVHGTLAVPSTQANASWSEAMLAELATAGLDGRGGGRFPTATKVAYVASQRRRARMVVNLMESEPASQKDSVLATFAPHLILDGAQVLAAIINADRVVVCIANDNDRVAQLMERAINDRRGLKERSMEIERPQGRYVASEETALGHYLDEGVSLPRFRTTRPSPVIAKSRVLLVDNAETCANVALIARHGGAWWAKGDIAHAPETTLVTVSGAVQTPGVFEIALGTTVADIVQLANPQGAISGLLLGGYGGTWVSAAALDAPYSVAGVAPFGGNLGAGIIIALGDDVCPLVETARITRWMANESAGQCGPCLFGLPNMADQLEALASGRHSARADRSILDLTDVLEGRGACAHPDGVIRMVRTALEVFADDLATHQQARTCGRVGSKTYLHLPDQEDLF